MVKLKEDSQKGMSKEEIYKKLDGFKTEEGKIGYLKKISEREGLLDKKTKDSIYETLGDLNFKKDDDGNAAFYYSKRGGNKKDSLKEGWKRLGDKQYRGGFVSDAINSYSKAGSEEKIKKISKEDLKSVLKKIGPVYEIKYLEGISDLNFNEEAKKFIYETLGDLYSEGAYGYYGFSEGRSNFKIAAENYEKAGNKEKAKKAFNTVGDKIYSELVDDHSGMSVSTKSYLVNLGKEAIEAYEKAGNKEKTKKAKGRVDFFRVANAWS